MTARREFVEEAERGLYSMTELCARYQISRRVGYKWLDRYRTHGLAGLADQRRAPTQCPHRTPEPIADALLDARAKHPTWGPRKLLSYLARRRPRTPWPAANTVGALLRAHGLVTPRRRRRPLGHPGRPTAPMDAPNAVWTADFKGDFAVRDGRRCYPLTIVDGCSRYLLACQGLAAPTHALSRPVFQHLFQEHGLPERLRSDNGAPFVLPMLPVQLLPMTPAVHRET